MRYHSIQPAFLLVLLLFLLAPAQGQPVKKRPNILWITAEDMSPHLGCYGEKRIRTPNIDKLAANGIRYTNAFTTAGVCAPSRSAIITGMYQTAIGTDNMRNYTPWNPQDPNSALPSYSAVPPPYVRCFPEYLRKAGYYCTNNAKEDYQFEAPVTVWNESSKEAHWRKRGKGQPFFAVFNFEITHESKLWQRDKEPLVVNPAEVNIPPYYPDIPEVRQALARNLSNIQVLDEQVGRLLQELEEDKLVEETIIFFYSDHGDGLPFVKREVYDRGLRIPLIIRFPNGFRKNTTDDQLISAIDFGPTVLSLAGIPTPTYMHGSPFLGPYARIKERRYIFAGRDRMDTEVDRVRSVHDGRFQYIRNYRPDLPRYQHILYRTNLPMINRMLQMRDSGLLNENQLFWFQHPKPEEELYDLQTDPYQLRNLAQLAFFQEQKKRLRTELENWLQQAGDAHVLPEKELVRKMWQGSDSPPQTATPRIRKQPKGLTLHCATPGASIGYQFVAKGQQPDKSSWQVYNGERLSRRADKELVVRAQRIGFLPAESRITL